MEGLMARIPDEVIDRLKAEVSLERLVEARGGWPCAAMAPIWWDAARSMTIGSRRWWSPRRRTCGIAWASARREGQRDRLGDAGGGGELSSRGGAAARRCGAGPGRWGPPPRGAGLDAH